MKHVKTLLQIILVISLLSVMNGAAKPVASAPLPFQKGLTYTTWPVGQYGTPDADLVLKDIQSIGANWIALIVTQFQEDLDTTEIFPTDETATDEELIHAIETAHALGLSVMLKPHLDPLVTTVDHWRGMIGQDFDEAQWAEWFAAYESMILHYAAMAETYDAEMFCVGVELVTSAEREADWRAMIVKVRAVYSGPITYAALHGSEVLELSWWDAVDYIGLDAYYSLAVGIQDPTVDDLKAAWEPIVAQIDALYNTWQIPILITELGYMSQDGNVQHPWNWPKMDGIVDMEEQAIAYQAAFESWYDQPWLAGIYIWDYGTDPFEGGPCDQHYTPNDKLAEEVLRAWYGGVAATSQLQPSALDFSDFDVYTDTLALGWSDQSFNSAVEWQSVSPVFSGTFAISATTEISGALSMQHAAFTSGPYGWLEFAVRKPAIGEQIRVFVTDENGTELRNLPLCRYMSGPIEAQNWNQVRIPLIDLQAPNRIIQQITFKNMTDQPQTFWLDEIRFVAANGRIYLPLLQVIH